MTCITLSIDLFFLLIIFIDIKFFIDKKLCYLFFSFINWRIYFVHWIYCM